MSKLTDYTDRVVSKYKNGTERGMSCGFKCLDSLVSFKRGYSTYFLAAPRAGKTELSVEILLNLTFKYESKHALYSPEIGSPEDVIAELASKWLKKPFYKESPYAMTEKELYNVIPLLSQYFYILDTDEDYTIEGFYQECEKIETDNDIKLHTTTIDPWNDVQEDLSTFGGREDKYLAHALKVSRNVAKKRNWHNIIVTHASENEQTVKMQDVNGKEHMIPPVPRLRSFAGGRVWGRRAMQVIALWRPEEPNIIGPDGMPMEDNQVLVKILKSKPKGVGAMGNAYLYFDWKTNRYYEKHFAGGSRYAWEYLEDEKPLDFSHVRQPHND